MVSDRHISDNKCFATFIQCLGAASCKSEVLSNSFVVDKIEELRNRQLSLEDISHSEGIFPTQKDLDHYLGEFLK